MPITEFSDPTLKEMIKSYYGATDSLDHWKVEALRQRLRERHPSALAIVVDWSSDHIDLIREASPTDRMLALPRRTDRPRVLGILDADHTMLEPFETATELERLFQEQPDVDGYLSSLDDVLSEMSYSDALRLIGWPDVTAMTDDETAHDEGVIEMEMGRNNTYDERRSVLAADLRPFFSLESTSPDADATELLASALTEATVAREQLHREVLDRIRPGLLEQYPTAHRALVAKLHADASDACLLAVLDAEDNVLLACGEVEGSDRHLGEDDFGVIEIGGWLLGSPEHETSMGNLIFLFTGEAIRHVVSVELRTDGRNGA